MDGAADHQLLPSDVALEFLPLAHVYERTAAYSYICNGVSVAYVERIEDVPQALLEVHPTIAASVPRFFEKIYANIIEKGHRETGIKREYFRLGASRRRRIRSVARIRQECIAGTENALEASPTHSYTQKFAKGWAVARRKDSPPAARRWRRSSRSFSGPSASQFIRDTDSPRLRPSLQRILRPRTRSAPSAVRFRTCR